MINGIIVPKTESSIVRYGIGMKTDGRFVVIEENVTTGERRARPLIVKNNFVFVADYEVEE